MKPIGTGELLDSLLRRRNSLSWREKIPAPARKIPCSAGQGICCKSLEMQRQFIAETSTPRRIRKNSLPKSWTAPHV